MFLIFHESKPLRSYTRGSYKKKKVYYDLWPPRRRKKIANLEIKKTEADDGSRISMRLPL